MGTTKNRHIPLDEKLVALQQSDSRKWCSLDDARVCALCEEIITGRMIDVWQDGKGAYHLHCPTSGCAGAPQDWYPHGVAQTPPITFDGTAELGLDFAVS